MNGTDDHHDDVDADDDDDDDDWLNYKSFFFLVNILHVCLME